MIRNNFKRQFMKKKKILVTGGAGYIGSHTIIEILERTDFEVVSVDNFSNSSPVTFDRIERVCGRRVVNYEIDLCANGAAGRLAALESDVVGVIHFAAFKSVPESVAHPTKYYQNNLVSLVSVAEYCRLVSAKAFIFSSSCSVYGNIDSLPVSEDTPLSRPESPYAHTKQIGETITQQYALLGPTRAISLRYFNPAGAHRTGLIGESPINPASSLIPIITQTAIGKREKMWVHGDDYATRDGSCIRDYIHVCDVATAHLSALRRLIEADGDRYDVINLGTGRGVSVKEAIESFERCTGVKLNYAIGARRKGDVIAIYSDTGKSQRLLNWTAVTSLDEMVGSAWKWEVNLREEKSKINVST